MCHRGQVAELLASGRGDLSLAEIARVFPFPMDRFQEKAVQILLRGASVVVSAPTGAGKTVIAEAATVAVLARCWAGTLMYCHCQGRLETGTAIMSVAFEEALVRSGSNQCGQSGARCLTCTYCHATRVPHW